MAFNVRNYIKTRLKEYNPELDVRDGSVISDVLINPLSLILDKYETTQEEILNKLSFSNIETMAPEELDNIGLQYLVTRQNGSYASGSIYLYFLNPTTVNLPKGTSFYKNNVEFKTTTSFYLSRSAIEQNVEETYYYVAGPIAIEAAEAGDFNYPAGTNFTTSYPLPITPSKIINKVSFTNGTVKETNTQYYNRIVNSIDGMSLSSPLAIKSAIQAYSPNIKMIDIIGAGSMYMSRDLVTELTVASQYSETDYKYAYSGIHNSQYDNKNIAYSDVFIDTDPTNEIAFPSISSWTTEFSDSLYESIYEKNDPNFAESSAKVHINDFVLGSGYVPDFGIFNNSSNSWKANDSMSVDNKLFIINEIEPTNEGIRLGKTNIAAQTNANVILPYSTLNSLVSSANTGTLTQQNSATRALLDYLVVAVQDVNINNFSPVIHRSLSQHQGIGIKCKMRTTDNTELGEMAYITVLRNDSIAAAHDGFGLAWKKQPEFLLRINANNYGQNALQLQADLEKFYNDYGEDGTSQLGGVHQKYWKYNVFLVDNNVLQEEIWVGTSQLIDQTNGINQFIQAAKVWIEPNVEYSFLMYIYEGSGVDAWVGTDPDLFDSSNKVISKGQSYPSYLPVSGTKNSGVNGQLSINSNRTHFGIGVGQTRNCEWFASGILVWAIIETFPMHLFSFKPDVNLFNTNEGLNLEYYGYGFDANLVQDDEYTLNRAKVKLGVYNFITDAWETLGTNTYDPYRNIIESYGPEPIVMDDIKISVTNYGTLSNYINPTSGRLFVAAVPANSGEGFNTPNSSDNKDHTLRTYYIKMHNGKTDKVHRNNCTDIYCYDPANLKLGSAVTTLVGNTINTKGILGINGYIQEILGVREYISQIDIPGTMYTIANVDEGNTYSNDANYTITFANNLYEGMLIEVYYRYWSLGVQVENTIITSDTRYPTADYKLKVSPSVVFNFKDLTYSGGLPLVQMKEKLKEYINSVDTGKIDKSDIVNVLYDNGANYVNLDMEIELRQYDTSMKKTIKNWTEQTYDVTQIPAYRLSKFYTDVNEMIGVIKL